MFTNPKQKLKDTEIRRQYVAIDHGEVTALILLDLSAAFNTVDHSTLLDVLHRRFTVEGIPLLWFNSYLSNRLQSFFVDGVHSKSIIVDCSVPQGSVLGPLKIITYTEDDVEISNAILSVITFLLMTNNCIDRAKSLKLTITVLNCAVASLTFKIGAHHVDYS